MRVAVIGANGQLGSEVVRAFRKNGDDVAAMLHSDIEITDIDSIFHRLREVRPQLVVNASAFHHVEKCELEPDKAYAVNAVGPKNLASVANDLEFTVAQISTDYVFDGSKRIPYEESDAAHPLNVYGRTKLAGEDFLRAGRDRHFVLRTSALYGKDPCRGKSAPNFIQLMLKLAKERGEVRVVDSEVVTPTSVEDVAHQLVMLSHTDYYGLYHATAEGSCSWYEFAREIVSVTQTRVRLVVADPQEFPAKVARPSYSVLENACLKFQGINGFGMWQDGLRRYLGIS